MGIFIFFLIIITIFKKMSKTFSACFTFIALFLIISPGGVNGQENGGVPCAACTVVVGLMEQVEELNANQTIQEIVDGWCDLYPGFFNETCTFLLDEFGETIIDLILEDFTADDVCGAIGICPNVSICRLFPQGNLTLFDKRRKEKVIETKVPPRVLEVVEKFGKPYANSFDSIFDWIYDLLNDKFGEYHEPIFDLDNDNFSLFPTLRGYNWRGKDCNDLLDLYHPGALHNESILDTDANCNGISGFNDFGQSYEELYCSDSGARGTIVMGDSAGAHFHIPPQWVTAKDLNKTTYSGLISIAENEVDWPHYSAYTGYMQSTPEKPVDSIYLRMRERNLCNHRDYQNCGVNGNRAGQMAGSVIKGIARNQTIDKPALVFIELVGNDVCFPDHDLNMMTSVSSFNASTMSYLQYLDTRLPKDSHVVFVGLANGSILWDSLYNRTHPIGVPYADVYDYLNCLEISPCWAWMNSNATIRNTAVERAFNLSQVYSEIIDTYTFENFDMAYYDFPFAQVIQEWEANGGEAWELIEPVDGFHPNQQANALIAEALWNSIMEDHPEFLGEVNPYNADILKKFGDQGGYE